MTRQEQIYNWLTTGLQQPTDRFSEIFYYDKRDNEFFSILVTDYFMFDENLNIAKDITTTYSKENLETLIDRIRRIENKDVAIISLPRLGNSPNTADTEFISQQTESFLNLNSINIETATIWEVEESGTITIDLKNERESLIKKPWWKVWK
ncbi:hypothetical protein GCM10008015_28760 [Flavobacterium palustre]|uniref:Uncharacterized protein n=1 Tax=Flavobacterium palustre TaxID=1476463 RepID=A0ABQ1HRQ4_9FLAO|nr:hypothetical protein [Flavobacterium palustre]GGA86304.1 hypothetical protein GCM10008015_28760 [Flavobacterium palustre]